MSSIFSQIISGKAEADIVYKDEYVTAFKDINPQAPIHLVVIPKKEIPKIDAMADEDGSLVGHLFVAIRKIATQLGLDDGFRVVINNGPDAGQEVMHIHNHIIPRVKKDGFKFWPQGSYREGEMEEWREKIAKVLK